MQTTLKLWREKYPELLLIVAISFTFVIMEIIGFSWVHYTHNKQQDKKLIRIEKRLQMQQERVNDLEYQVEVMRLAVKLPKASKFIIK